MQTKLTIGERMKDLRVEKGLTLEALGQQTGLSRSALGNYESGNFKEIRYNKLRKIGKKK